MSSSDGESLGSHSDEENNLELTEKISSTKANESELNKETMQEEQSESEIDSQINDLEEDISTEKESDDESIFEYEDEIID